MHDCGNRLNSLWKVVNSVSHAGPEDGELGMRYEHEVESGLTTTHSDEM